MTDRSNAQRQTEGKSIRLAGSIISSGLASGEAFVYRDLLLVDRSDRPVRSSDTRAELQRLDRAKQAVVEDLQSHRLRIRSQMDSSLADIFKAHQRMLKDPLLLKEVVERIESDSLTADDAVGRIFRRWIARFRESNDSLMSSHADDIADLGRRLLRKLAGIETHPIERMPAGSVLVAERLAPSDAVCFCNRAAAVVVEMAAPESHCALMARHVGIPVIGNVPDVTETVRPGVLLLVDGLEGTVEVDPDEATRTRFEQRRIHHEAQGAAARAQADRKAVTPDGVAIRVAANITCRQDAELAAANGADGIGLYRTEALFMYRSTLPGEQELVEAFSHAIDPLGDRFCIVRLVDVGGDKTLPYLKMPPETSPFLGRRGIRLLKAYPELLETQLRALLLLSQRHNLQIMVPMVTIPEDMKLVRETARHIAGRLGVARVPPLVAMIETPAAALCVKGILRYADALSIGTNDLTQYVMAAGRQNPLANEYFRQDHPAVMRLIDIACRDAGSAIVGMCGELAGHTEAAPALVRAGVRLFSVAPRLVPLVKQAIRTAPAGTDASPANGHST